MDRVLIGMPGTSGASWSDLGWTDVVLQAKSLVMAVLIAVSGAFLLQNRKSNCALFLLEDEMGARW